MFVLTDGAYPQFDRFVKPLRFPVLPEERKFMEWQSAARKDIERAFGLLQMKFKAVANPIQLHNIKDVAIMVKCCLGLHNMCVSDRIMNGDFSADYDPTKTLLNKVWSREEAVVINNTTGTSIGLAATRRINPVVFEAVTRSERFQNMTDMEQNKKLRKALIERFQTV
jgi:hypothetical protein